MDRGDLVPDEVIIGVIAERIESPEAADGFILDGFPRTTAQAEALDEAMDRLGRELTAAILIEVSDEEVVRRLSGRRTCVKGAHLPRRLRPAEEGRCVRHLRGQLVVRDDDKPDVVRHRLEEYHSKTEPLVSYYEEKGILCRVDGDHPPEEVSDRTARCWLPSRWRSRSDVSRHRRQNSEQIERMAVAGSIQARCLRMLASKARPGATTADLDAAAERFIASQGSEAAFKGYRGFPGSICTSPNSMVVHGIPGPYELRKGDLLSIDVGVIHDGWVADAAITLPIGPVDPGARKLLEATREALLAGTDAARPGNHLGDISHAVQRRVESDGLSVIRSLVGHGIGRDMHEDPQVPNYGEPGAAPSSSRGWCSRSSRWSTRARRSCGSATTTGPCTRRTARSPRTSSSPSP